MSALLAYWQSLGRRERLIVIVGAALTLIILGYALVWEPWHRRLGQLRVQVPSKQETLAWMTREAARIEPLARRRAQTRGEALPILTVIEQSATRAELRDAIRRMQPAEDDQVRVWLSDAHFDPWLQWVETLKREGIEVVEATVNRAPQNTVNIRATFQRL